MVCAQAGASRESFDVEFSNAVTGVHVRVRSHREEINFASVQLADDVLARADSVLDDVRRQERARRHALEVL